MLQRWDQVLASMEVAEPAAVAPVADPGAGAPVADPVSSTVEAPMVAQDGIAGPINKNIIASHNTLGIDGSH